MKTLALLIFVSAVMMTACDEPETNFTEQDMIEAYCKGYKDGETNCSVDDYHPILSYSYDSIIFVGRLKYWRVN